MRIARFEGLKATFGEHVTLPVYPASRGLSPLRKVGWRCHPEVGSESLGR